MTPVAAVTAGRMDAIIKTPAAGLHREKHMILPTEGGRYIQVTNHMLPRRRILFFYSFKTHKK